MIIKVSDYTKNKYNLIETREDRSEWIYSFETKDYLEEFILVRTAQFKNNTYDILNPNDLVEVEG